jgi:hypothetical protein
MVMAINFTMPSINLGGGFAIDPSKFNFTGMLDTTTPDPLEIVAPTPEPEPVIPVQDWEAVRNSGMLTGEPVTPPEPVYTPAPSQPTAPVVTASPEPSQPVTEATTAPSDVEGINTGGAVESVQPSASIQAAEEEIINLDTDFNNYLASLGLTQEDYNTLDFRAVEAIDNDYGAWKAENTLESFTPTAPEDLYNNLDTAFVDGAANYKDGERLEVSNEIKDYFTASVNSFKDTLDPQGWQSGENEQRLQDYKTQLGQELIDKYGLVTDVAYDQDEGWYLNPETMNYEWYDVQMAADLGDYLKMGLVAGATFATGGALASAGLGNTAAGAIASGGVTAATGGDLDDVLKAAALGGLGGYIKDANIALNDAAEAFASNEAIASSSIAGEAAMASSLTEGLADNLITATDNYNTAVTASNLISAAEQLENGNTLAAINSGLAAFGVDNVDTQVGDYIAEQTGSDFIAANSEAVGSATVKAVEGLVEGKSLEDTAISSAIDYVRSGGQIPVEFDSDGLDLDIPVSDVKDWLAEQDDEYIQPVIAAIKEAGGDVEETLLYIANEVGATATEVYQNTVEPAVNAVVDAGNAILDATQDEREAVVDAVENVAGGVSDVGEAAYDATIEAAEDTAQLIRDGVDEVAQIVDDATDSLQGGFGLDTNTTSTSSDSGFLDALMDTDVSIDIGFQFNENGDLVDEYGNIIQYARSMPYYDTSIEDLANLLLKPKI